MTLKKIFSDLSEDLDKLDRDREEILKITRNIVRDCSVAIKYVHRKEFNKHLEKVENIKEKLKNVKSIVTKDPGMFFKYLKIPEQEYTEAVVFHSIITKQSLPSPSDLDIAALHYALGMADVIGELRRFALNNIRHSQIDELDDILENMDEIYNFLFSLDYPSGLTQDLRHKTDQARNIIEKTRGDISLTLQMYDLRKCIENRGSLNKE
jgi:translin